MDLTRVHLFITHLPVFGLFLGFMAVLYGIVVNSRQVKIVSLMIIITATVGAIIAFQTGEAAEETAEHLAGVLEDSIHEHEESAELAIGFFYGLGVISIIAFYLQVREVKFARELLFLVFAFSVVTFGLVVRTASLGGQIRHTEITGDKNLPATESPQADDSD
ncbi:MAG TPA: hypothetical protein VFO54_03265 [Chryseosolibacter sp.]|nr:hypothetical protein [Chryseosolibacter sp.]